MHFQNKNVYLYKCVSNINDIMLILYYCSVKIQIQVQGLAYYTGCIQASKQKRRKEHSV